MYDKFSKTTQHAWTLVTQGLIQLPCSASRQTYMSTHNVILCSSIYLYHRYYIICPYNILPSCRIVDYWTVNRSASDILTVRRLLDRSLSLNIIMCDQQFLTVFLMSQYNYFSASPIVSQIVRDCKKESEVKISIYWTNILLTTEFRAFKSSETFRILLFTQTLHFTKSQTHEKHD